MEIDEVNQYKEVDMSVTEEEIKTRTKIQDERVLLKQTKVMIEERNYLMKKEQAGLERKNVEKKRKRQLSIPKKKSKKKSKKEKAKVSDTQKNKTTKLEDLDLIYQALFSDVGLDVRNYCICRTRGDGACGAHCVALNFYHDETLGHYVRRNVNNHIVDFWPFYEPFVKFPCELMAGSKSIPFKDKDEFLKFLKNDERSSKLWMDHHDLQAVSNMYQVPVHILTTGVGMVEP